MARQTVEMEVALLDVLAMVRLTRHEAEVALLEDRVLLVPERQRPAEDLITITETGDAVLTPAESFRARQVVRKVRPGIAIRAVVLAHRPPRAVGEIRTPFSPAGDFVGSAGEPGPFRGRGCRRLNGHGLDLGARASRPQFSRDR